MESSSLNKDDASFSYNSNTTTWMGRDFQRFTAIFLTKERFAF
jgi:hypothetical protein